MSEKGMPSQPAAKTNRKIKQCALIKIQQQNSTSTTDGIGSSSSDNNKKAPSQPKYRRSVWIFHFFGVLLYTKFTMNRFCTPPLHSLSRSFSLFFTHCLLLGAFSVHSLPSTQYRISCNQIEAQSDKVSVTHKQSVI